MLVPTGVHRGQSYDQSDTVHCGRWLWVTAGRRGSIQFHGLWLRQLDDRCTQLHGNFKEVLEPGLPTVAFAACCHLHSGLLRGVPLVVLMVPRGPGLEQPVGHLGALLLGQLSYGQVVEGGVSVAVSHAGVRPGLSQKPVQHVHVPPGRSSMDRSIPVLVRRHRRVPPCSDGLLHRLKLAIPGRLPKVIRSHGGSPAGGAIPK
mmetsp:Transcript_93450/g.213689  ORF Transcript_93450/g.213689 Transcript_93450/m.213689 type:complete len:203 (+) Transcript_93450:131-739(+)